MNKSQQDDEAKFPPESCDDEEKEDSVQQLPLQPVESKIESQIGEVKDSAPRPNNNNDSLHEAGIYTDLSDTLDEVTSTNVASAIIQNHDASDDEDHVDSGSDDDEDNLRVYSDARRDEGNHDVRSVHQVALSLPSPSFRTRRRRRRSLMSCALDLAQRLESASNELLDRLLQQSESPSSTAGDGLSIPVTALAWLLLLLDDSKHAQENQNRNPLVQGRGRALRDLSLPHIRQLRVTQITAWPAVNTHRDKSWSFPRGTTNTTQNTQGGENDDRYFCHWLEHYVSWQRRPLLNPELCKLFPNLAILWMDQVPSSCFDTTGLFPALAPQLQVLRLEKLSLENLKHVDMFQSLPLRAEASESASSAGDPLAPLTSASGTLLTLFPKMTHLTITHCSLPVSSLSPDPTNPSNVKPVWDHFPSLQSVVLTHNGESLRAEFWRGLSSLTQLEKLNISHNHQREPTKNDATVANYGSNVIRYSHLELQEIYCHVGNIVELNASYSDLTNTEGLDRLFSLERLFLQFNRLSDLASIRGLTCLPQLALLTLYGNPLAMLANQTTTASKDSRGTRKTRVQSPSKAYRLAVLDLFWQATSGRQLPILDHHPATAEELMKLQKMSYPKAETPVILRPEEKGFVGRRGQSTKQRRRFVAKIEQNRELLSSRQARNSNISVGTPKLKFGVADVMKSIPVLMEPPPPPAPVLAIEQEIKVNDDKNDGVAPGEEGDKSLSDTVDNNNKKVPRVVSAVEEEVMKEEKSEEPADVEEVGALVESSDKVIQVQRKESEEQDDKDLASDQTPPPEATLTPDRAVRETFETGEAASEDELPTKNDVDIVETTPARNTNGNLQSGADEVLGSLPISPVREEGSRNVEILDPESRKVLFASKASSNSDLDVSQVSAVSVESREISEASTVESSALHSAMMLSFATGTDWGQQNTSGVDDNTSTQGSAVTPSRLDDRRKYIVAEEKSSFLGPPIYKQISVLENLDIYFQLFVFSTAVATSVTNSLFASVDPEETELQNILESYPRIQLWPVDRRIQEQEANSRLSARGLATQEEFRLVWRERVLGCGRPSLKRLTPTWTPRLGFRGTLVWPVRSTTPVRSKTEAADVRPEGVVIERDAILCCSDVAFYVIMDHSSRSQKIKGATKPPRNSFPKPIPSDACFAEAVWPHALARHPWTQLQRITIGFGFQRLSLRFRTDGGDSGGPSEEFCYILLTSSKLQTVRLLKEFQDLANSLAVAIDEPTGFGSETDKRNSRSVDIENDDPLVLDGLGATVGNSLGAVLHFQIVHQYWKNNDRGMVRRLCVVTDTKLYLVDEDYFGDGARVEEAAVTKQSEWGKPVYRIVDMADLAQIISVEPGSSDPCALTIAIRPSSRLYRTHNWRLVCRERDGAESLIEAFRKAMTMASM